MRTNVGLDLLNFALAGAREGFGPFLGVYLQARGFDPAATGIAMSLAGASGLLATTPIGAAIDRTTRKRTAMLLSVTAIAVGAVVIVATKHLWAIGAAQLLIGIGDTAVAPLVAALTLGLVGMDAFAARMSRNEAWNHAGNAANAAIAATLGYTLGLGWIALAIAAKALASALALTGIHPARINHTQARSGEADERSTLRVLAGMPDLLLLAAITLLFQTASGALAPFLAQARTAAGSDPSLTTGAIVVIARAVMVPAALLAPILARRFGSGGYGPVMTVALALTVLRGLLAAVNSSWASIVGVEVLEGAAVGLSSVAIPALSADIMQGTGRASTGLAAVLTAFGIGATLSPLVAGFAAQSLSFRGAFLILAAISFAGCVIWVAGRRRLAPLASDAG